jgi:hypothetical protein
LPKGARKLKRPKLAKGRRGIIRTVRLPEDIPQRGILRRVLRRLGRRLLGPIGIIIDLAIPSPLGSGEVPPGVQPLPQPSRPAPTPTPTRTEPTPTPGPIEIPTPTPTPARSTPKPVQTPGPVTPIPTPSSPSSTPSSPPARSPVRVRKPAPVRSTPPFGWPFPIPTGTPPRLQPGDPTSRVRPIDRPAPGRAPPRAQPSDPAADPLPRFGNPLPFGSPLTPLSPPALQSSRTRTRKRDNCKKCEDEREQRRRPSNVIAQVQKYDRRMSQNSLDNLNRGTTRGSDDNA